MFKYILHNLNPEFAHDITIKLCAKISKIDWLISLIEKYYRYENKTLEVKLGNLTFPNPIGLAAGFDKNGVAIPIWESLGFGFVEIGTVTPYTQDGNDKPRLFRLKKDKSIINRMGFNNDGVTQMVLNNLHKQYKVPIGVNLGKNFGAPLKDAANDYITGIKQAWDVADYFTINISSPNTENLRDLQNKEFLKPLLQKIVVLRNNIADITGEYKQIWIKIAPDLNDEQIKDIADISLELWIDALIVSNTTDSRYGVMDFQKVQVGGLSGRPLFYFSNNVLQKIREFTDDRIPLIGVGGIFSEHDVLRKFELGAKLVQVYTGLIYEGPRIVKAIKQGIVSSLLN
jgi:dihydroorotate dehydrogenase